MTVEISKTDSIKSCRNLLQAIIHDPKTHMVLGVELLKDQASLARLDLPEHGIAPMSLNRWKHYADEVLPDGWRGLDALRKEALRAFRSASKRKTDPSRGSRDDIKARLDDANKTAQSYLNEITRFAEQYTHLIEICHIHAKSDQEFKRLFDRHLSRYSTNRDPLTVIVGGKND